MVAQPDILQLDDAYERQPAFAAALRLWDPVSLRPFDLVIGTAT